MAAVWRSLAGITVLGTKADSSTCWSPTNGISCSVRGYGTTALRAMQNAPTSMHKLTCKQLSMFSLISYTTVLYISSPRPLFSILPHES